MNGAKAKLGNSTKAHILEKLLDPMKHLQIIMKHFINLYLVKCQLMEH
jgi:hypothetical protein